jgi:hypothetical protein
MLAQSDSFKRRALYSKNCNLLQDLNCAPTNNKQIISFCKDEWNQKSILKDKIMSFLNWWHFWQNSPWNEMDSKAVLTLCMRVWEIEGERGREGGRERNSTAVLVTHAVSDQIRWRIKITPRKLSFPFGEGDTGSQSYKVLSLKKT